VVTTFFNPKASGLPATSQTIPNTIAARNAKDVSAASTLSLIVVVIVASRYVQAGPQRLPWDRRTMDTTKPVHWTKG
jgi:hypothetical protein